MRLRGYDVAFYIKKQNISHTFIYSYGVTNMYITIYLEQETCNYDYDVTISK